MRKGHGSTKVPNVKLRPAAPRASSSQSTEPTHSVFNTEPNDEELATPKERPFTGVVLALTGVSNKSEVFKKATSMGAESSLHLTDRVTHLIAVEPGSDKYNVAVQRKIAIMSERWIHECYEMWLEGMDINLEQSIEEYRLHVFQGLTLAVTWMADYEQRQDIGLGVKEQSGGWISKMKTISSITHLICGPDGGKGVHSDKLEWAIKRNAEVERTGKGKKVHIVWEEWYHDSIEFGGVWPEEEYYITHPKPQRKVFVPPPQGSFQVSQSIASSRSQSVFDLNSSLAPTENVSVSSSRLMRVGSQRVLQDIIRSRKDWKVEEGRIGRKADEETPAIVEADATSASSQTSRVALRGVARRASLFSADSGSTSGRRPLEAIATTPAERTTSIRPFVGGELENSLFKGTLFVVLGDMDAPQVVERIQKCGGEVASLKTLKAMTEAQYILVRMATGGSAYRKLSEDLHPKIRTECWLERCHAANIICDVNKHPVFSPITIPIPLQFKPDEHMLVNFSGLDHESTTWVKRVCSALGIINPPKFTAKSTHLICPSRTGAKYDKAVEWGIPVVELEWLWELMQKGIPGSSGSSRSTEPPVTENPKSPGVVKSEVENHPMTDITNGPTPPSDSAIHKSPSPKRPLEDTPAADLNDRNDTSLFGASILSGVPPASSREGPSPLKRARTVAEADLLSAGPPRGVSSTPKRSSTISSHRTPNQASPLRKTVSEVIKGTRDFVPSSNTASPVTPVIASQVRPSTQVSTELRHTITELLGTEIETESVAEAPPEVEDSPGIDNGDGSRRPRPARSKSHSTSDNPLSRNASTSSAQANGAPAHPALHNGTSQGEEWNESMRVTYQDPVQEREQRRLMKLLSGSQSSKSKKTKDPKKLWG